MTAGAYGSPAARRKILFYTFRRFRCFQRCHWRFWSRILCFCCGDIRSREEVFNPTLSLVRRHVTYIITLRTFPRKVSGFPTSSAEHRNWVPVTCGIHFHWGQNIGCSCWYPRILRRSVGECWGDGLARKHSL